MNRLIKTGDVSRSTWTIDLFHLFAFLITFIGVLGLSQLHKLVHVYSEATAAMELTEISASLQHVRRSGVASSSAACVVKYRQCELVEDICAVSISLWCMP